MQLPGEFTARTHKPRHTNGSKPQQSTAAGAQQRVADRPQITQSSLGEATWHHHKATETNVIVDQTETLSSAFKSFVQNAAKLSG